MNAANSARRAAGIQSCNAPNTRAATAGTRTKGRPSFTINHKKAKGCDRVPFYPDLRKNHLTLIVSRLENTKKPDVTEHRAKEEMKNQKLTYRTGLSFA